MSSDERSPSKRRSSSRSRHDISEKRQSSKRSPSRSRRRSRSPRRRSRRSLTHSPSPHRRSRSPRRISSRSNRHRDASPERRRPSPGRRSSPDRRPSDRRPDRDRGERRSSRYSPPQYRNGRSPRRDSRRDSPPLRQGGRDGGGRDGGGRDGGGRDGGGRGSSSYPSSYDSRASKKSWRFDSPPRDDTNKQPFESFGSGLGIISSTTEGPLTVNDVPGTVSIKLPADHPQVTSQMAVMVQSLGLTPEQEKGARELYIGNLPPGLDVNQLLEYVNASLMTVKISPWPGTPVIRAWIAKEKNFGYVELRSIEETTLGLQLNGTNCLGYTLRLGRPKSYPAEYASLLSALPAEIPGSGPPPSPAAALAAATAAAAGVGGGLHGLYGTSAIFATQLGGAGVPRRVQEDRPDRLALLDLPNDEEHSQTEIQKLLSSFGGLKAFQYIDVPATETSAKYGVCIFEYSEITHQRAMITALEHRNVAGGRLKVTKAEDAIKDGKLSEMMELVKASGRDLTEELGGELMRPQVATRCLMLANLVSRQELIEDQEFFEIVDDVTLECSEFGKVIAVEIPRPIRGMPINLDQGDVGFAFVEFATIEGAGAARKSLSGRKFAGRTVEAHYFSELLFNERKFKNPQPNFDPSHSSSKNPSLAAHVNLAEEGSSAGALSLAPASS